MAVLLSFWRGTASQSALTSAINFKCLFLYANIYIFRARVGFFLFSFFLLLYFFFPISFFFRLSDSLNPYPLKLMTILCWPRLWQCNTALADPCSLSDKAWRRSSHQRRASCTLSKPAAVTWTAEHLALHGRHEESFQWCRLTLFPFPPARDARAHMHMFMAFKKHHFQRKTWNLETIWNKAKMFQKSIPVTDTVIDSKQASNLVWPSHTTVCPRLLRWRQSTLIEGKPVRLSFVQLSHLCLGQPSTFGQKSATAVQIQQWQMHGWSICINSS